MRFKVKKKPEIGATRSVVKFAWFPILLSKRPRKEEKEYYWVWLERYVVDQVYSRFYLKDYEFEYTWIDTHKYLKE